MAHLSWEDFQILSLSLSLCLTFLEPRMPKAPEPGEKHNAKWNDPEMRPLLFKNSELEALVRGKV